MPAVMTSRRHARRQRGLTIIELMIAVTVALVLLAALAAMYGSSVKARNDIERTNRQIENGRYAIQLLRDDLQLAGFWGEYNILDQGLQDLGSPTVVPDVCVNHTDANPADGFVASDRTGDGPTPNGLDYLAVAMLFHVQGVDGNAAAPVLPTCVGDVRPGTDILIVRRAMTCDARPAPFGDSNCTFSNDMPYLQAAQCATQVNAPGASGSVVPPPGSRFQLLATTNINAFTRTDLNCPPGSPPPVANRTPIRRYLVHIYFIANNNVAGDGIPTLKRLELISDGWTTTALVEGIEDMQFEYGVDGDDLDSDGVQDATFDGMPDEYVDDPVGATKMVFDGTNDAVKAWSSVMTVRVYLLSRGTGNPRPGFADENTYVLANSSSAKADRSADENRYARQVFQTLVQFRNASGRRQ